MKIMKDLIYLMNNKDYKINSKNQWDIYMNIKYLEHNY
jgi:hypothetical protein